MSNLVSPEGLRTDGRRPFEPRATRIRLGLVDDPSQCDGSAYLECGGTRVLATANGPMSLSSSPFTVSNQSSVSVVPDTNIGVLVEIASATFAQGERRVRSRLDKMLSYVREAVSKSLAAVVLPPPLYSHAASQGTFHSSANSTPHYDMVVVIGLQVLANDGGLLATCIQAASWACADAGVMLRDVVGACQVAAVPMPRSAIGNALAPYAASVFDEEQTGDGASRGNESAASSGMTTLFMVDPVSREEASAAATLTAVYLQHSNRVVSVSMDGRLRAPLVPIAMEWARQGAVTMAKRAADVVRVYASQRAAIV
eukprot:ANDGO_07001.mRNA.1 Exosome complex component RRP41 homolog